MSLEIRPIEAKYTQIIHRAISGNVAEYFYNFKTEEETRKWVEDAISQHQTGIKEEYVIFDDSEFIGMVSPNFMTPTEVEIGIWISEDKQGKGYAKKVLTKLFEVLSERNVKEIYYETQTNNEASIRLAESLGFVCIIKTNDTLRYKKHLS